MTTKTDLIEGKKRLLDNSKKVIAEATLLKGYVERRLEKMEINESNQPLIDSLNISITNFNNQITNETFFQENF